MIYKYYTKYLINSLHFELNVFKLSSLSTRFTLTNSNDEGLSSNGIALTCHMSILKNSILMTKIAIKPLNNPMISCLYYEVDAPWCLDWLLGRGIPLWFVTTCGWFMLVCSISFHELASNEWQWWWRAKSFQALWLATYLPTLNEKDKSRTTSNSELFQSHNARLGMTWCLCLLLHVMKPWLYSTSFPCLIISFISCFVCVHINI